MKFFGEYLVDKGMVASETMVEALIDQLKELPTIAEIVWMRTREPEPANSVHISDGA